jgi:hypothetical protein
MVERISTDRRVSKLLLGNLVSVCVLAKRLLQVVADDTGCFFDLQIKKNRTESLISLIDEKE